MFIYTACVALSSSSDSFVYSYPLASQSTLNCPQLSALIQFLLNSTIICPALVDITASVDITFFALLANMRRHQLVDSSSDEYELTDSEIEYHSGLETELTGVDDDDADEVIKDVEDAKG